MTTITVLSGHGDYADPWHPFDETSQRLAALLAPLGEVTVRVDVEAALAGLTATDARPDLLVFNISRDEGVEPSTPPESAQTGLLAHLADGRPILAVHSASRAFADWPEWSSILGGHWEDGLTFHPERGVAHIVPTDLAGELLGRGQSFHTVDERYTALVLEPDTQPLATHEHGGSEHPLAWFTTFGDAEVVYSALGHDTEAYESPDAAAFVSGAAAWLLREHARSAG